ncbi:unnamed protein product [Microthlaspi erraticum]|uniref:Uncharacterized protein n=1 Tax=Microthlaspi erraticum TaxID=1685480 RepID=A0A6D2JZS4_9BRAS|nr:unnamed protein product [Microthlaspi erraticum]
MGSMAAFLKAVNKLEEPVQKLMEEMTPRPSCLISDMSFSYTTKIARVQHTEDPFPWHVLLLSSVYACSTQEPGRQHILRCDYQHISGARTAYVKDFKEARAGKVWSIGPVSLCNKVGADKAERGNKSDIDQGECLKWLDSKEEVGVICLPWKHLQSSLSQLKELG